MELYGQGRMTVASHGRRRNLYLKGLGGSGPEDVQRRRLTVGFPKPRRPRACTEDDRDHAAAMGHRISSVHRLFKLEPRNELQKDGAGKGQADDQ